MVRTENREKPSQAKGPHAWSFFVFGPAISIWKLNIMSKRTPSCAKGLVKHETVLGADHRHEPANLQRTKLTAPPWAGAPSQH